MLEILCCAENETFSKRKRNLNESLCISQAQIHQQQPPPQQPQAVVVAGGQAGQAQQLMPQQQVRRGENNCAALKTNFRRNVNET